MTHIYLVRHAEAEGNLYRIAQGQGNSNLTDRGWRQVQALERRFADIQIDAVYASDLYRTCATASAIYKPKGLVLHRSRELREICVECGSTAAGERFTAAGRKRWSISPTGRIYGAWRGRGPPGGQRPGAGCHPKNRSAAYGGNGGSVFSRLCAADAAFVLTGLFSGRTGPDTHGGQHSRLTAGGGGRCAARGVP